jgi:hypothetical protein
MTLWLPAVSVLVVNVAVPPDSVTGVPAVPSTVNVAVPAGVKPGQLTLVVKVTDWPCLEGFCDEASVTLVPAVPTDCVRVADVEAAQLASPEYAAVTVWLPGLRLLVVRLAVPPLSVTVVCATPSIVKVMVPVGVKFGQVTVAVKVTGCPGAEGLADDIRLVPAPAWLTVCVIPFEVDDWQLESPLYTAVAG